MPKKAGVKGGSRFSIPSQQEYDALLLFLKTNKTKEEEEKLTNLLNELGKDKCKSLKRRAPKFQLHTVDVPNLGDSWPNKTEVLVIRCPEGITTRTKVFVPEWRKEALLERYHRSNGEAGHYSGRKLYKSVSRKVRLTL